MTTALTLDELLNSFADNNTGNIGADDLRNFVCSVELKYDNWTVVKPSQPEGNKFPDPVAGVSTLDDGTVWVINGDVTIDFSLKVDGEVQIVGLARSPVVDKLFLDPAAGAIPLFTNTGSDILTVRDVWVSTQTFTAAGSGRLLDFTGGNVVEFVGCSILDIEFGSISNLGALEFTNCRFGVIVGGLTATGNMNLFRVNGGQLLAGFLGILDTVFDLTSVSGLECIAQNMAADIDLVYNFIEVADDDTFDSTLVSGNNIKELSTGKFFAGVDVMTGIKTTFTGNAGIPNTKVQGGLVMAGNTTVTVNPGAGLWTPIVGNMLDVLTSNSQRFIRSGDLALQYVGEEDFEGTLTVNVTTRRSVGGGDRLYDITALKNGVPVDESGVEITQQTDTDGSTPQNVVVTIPITLVTGDTLVPAIRGDGNSDDTVTRNIQFAQE